MTKETYADKLVELTEEMATNAAFLEQGQDFLLPENAPTMIKVLEEVVEKMRNLYNTYNNENGIK